MKSVLVAVFLFVALANCLNPFSEYVSTLKNEKRGSNNVGECFPATCGGVGDHCLGPNDIPSCGAACALALGTCAEQNQGIQTCDCLAAAVACLNATQSSECIFASYALFARCASSGNCQVNECGVPPSQVPPVPTCINSFCEDQTCMALGDTGAACIDDSQCMGLCNNGTCLTFPMMGPGDGCSANEQCYTMNCTNNVCRGIAAGGNCMYSSQCDAGLYCGDSSCIPYIASGGACQSSGDCGMWGICKAGVCIDMYSTAPGAACTEMEECTFGYVCGPAGTCIAYEAIVPEGPCSTQTDCTTAYGVSSQCNCNPMIGANLCVYTNYLLPQCATAFTAMATCLVTSGCGSFNPLPGSCSSVHCGNEVNCAVRCLLETDDGVKPIVEAGCFPIELGTCVSTTGEQTTTGEAQTTTGEAQTTTGEAQTTTGEAQTTTGEAQTTTGEAQTTTGAAQTTTGAAQGTTGQVTTTGAGADDSSASSVVLSFFTLCLILIALF